MAQRYSVVDLFAGAGGLSLGFAKERFDTVAAVELSREASATYSSNHAGVSMWTGDISDWLKTSDVPRADIVIGGPPCQGFSNLGARRVRDPRNALWRRYVDTLTLVRPRYFVLENVADFLNSGQFRDLKRETHRSGRLSEYRIEAAVLNAAEFGVPQVRKRAVVLGSHRDVPALGTPVGHLAGRPEQWATVRDAIGDLSSEVAGIDLPEGPHRLGSSRPFRTHELHLGRRPTQLSLDRYAAIPEGGNRYNLPEHLLAECWKTHHDGSGDVMGRLHWDRPSVTIRTEFWKPEKGRYLHPVADRPITHLEAARLQGFPDEYLWHGSKTEIGRQIGNAVPFKLAQAIAVHLEGHLEGRVAA